MKKTTGITWAWLAILAMLLNACSGSELAVQDAWSRPGSLGGTSAVYFTVENPASESDTLLSASAEVAEHVELHRSEIDEQGTSSMHPQHALEVPARGRLEFAPGGLHVMLIDLAQDLNPGDTFTLTLELAQAGALDVPVTVREP